MPDSAPACLVIAIGSTGDIHPMLRIACTLRALGRPVTFVTHSAHRDLVRRQDLPLIALGTDAEYRRVLRDPDVWSPTRGFAALFAHYDRILRQLLDALEPVTRDAAPLAIAHPLAVPALAIARARGRVASVAAAWLAPSNLRTVHDPLTLGPIRVPRWFPMPWRRALWRIAESRWINPVALRAVNGLRAEHDLAPVQSFLGHLGDAPDLSVTLFPPWFGPTMPDWPRPLIEGDFPLFDASADEPFSDELQAFLTAGEQPLVFTPGSANVHAEAFFRSALAAAERLGRRAVLLTREHAQVPDNLPATVLWQRYVPLCKLLGHVAALVHHGGIGTTAEALRAGVPQLVTPFAWDQFDNGARVVALGAGMMLPARRLRPRRLIRALGTLLTSDSIRQRSAHCAALCAHARDDTTDFCRAIEARLRASESRSGQGPRT